MEKENKALWVILGIAAGFVLAMLGMLIYNKYVDTTVNTNNESEEKLPVENGINDTNDKTQTEINGTPLGNINIPNNEIKELYDYVKVDQPENSVCFINYYIKHFDKTNINDLVDIVIKRYGEKYSQEITNEVLNKFDVEERDFIKNNSMYYIKGEVIRRGMKEIFDINISKLEQHPSSINWGYSEEADIYVDGSGGGGYDGYFYSQIIDYKVENDNVYITTVKAELHENNNVYRYSNDENTLVYKNVKDFKFTKENIKLFPQIQYVFKKNNAGEYYVYDIVNLNFQKDFLGVCE